MTPSVDNEGQHPDILESDQHAVSFSTIPTGNHERARHAKHNFRNESIFTPHAGYDTPMKPGEMLVLNGVPQTERGRELLAEANRKLAAGQDPKERGNDVGCILGDNKLREGRRRLMMAGEKRSIGLWSKRSSASGS